MNDCFGAVCGCAMLQLFNITMLLKCHCAIVIVCVDAYIEIFVNKECRNSSIPIVCGFVLRYIDVLLTNSPNISDIDEADSLYYMALLLYAFIMIYLYYDIHLYYDMRYDIPLL